MKVELSDSSSKAQDTTNSISSNCQMKVNQQIKHSAMNPNDAINSFVSCAQPLIANKIEELNKEIKEQSRLRNVFGWKMGGLNMC